ncbi:Crp/Fnr family transcriptional regulator [uncultured Draconibacterium sp.]|uniref:Crp/Fnr family transcriptional regulator n=1 Tax=uncultured Draconibacterium sp. TaxID=1573823 RepID=UPI0032163A75
MPEQLKYLIQKHTELPDKDWDAIKSEFVQQNFRKEEAILEEGKTCRYFYFFESGLIRFYCNIDGADITKTFAIAPYCFTSRVSFRDQTPANEAIKALEDTVVWKITFEQYKKLEQVESWNRFMRKLIAEIQDFTENRMLVSKIYTAEENYQQLLKDYPAELMQKIPLKHMASFLGVAPQSLSRIRKKLHNNGRS